ncbi:hypothetical protein L873DRAFT_1779487 [Choiromyces venosus 120613-1]|uniref:Uncharacterized protein n=1 Tax=Choiromyces venosus 120613-1 TaxID=1336337 RepID=A0A3N4J5A7_9PEZI|nr:hypothetical protein L873DRAFT_1779487 [Choiromyces venosus 120613-1]
MEESPLALAHSHACQASKILSSAQPPYPSATLLAAANSHALAATSFTAAAKLTKDPEALRTLELMTKEHERWEAQLRRDAERPAQKNKDQENQGGLDTVVESGGSGTTSEPSKGGGKVLSKDTPTPPPSLPFANTGGAPYPPRLQKSTSSLATNLASARGIQLPGSSRVPGASSQSPNRRRTGERPPAIDVSAKPTTNPLTILPPDEPKRKDSEEGFSIFYSSLNTFISRVGSPFATSLAFAGLPLLNDEGRDEEKDREARRNVLPKSWVEKHGRGRGLEKGWPTSDPNGGESFYVVPVSGGTLSYAGVVRRDASPTNQNSPIDDFESLPRDLSSRAFSPPPPPPPPAQQGQRDPGLSGHTKTKEELQLENTGLRQTIDHMSRTMQSWQRKTRESENMLKNSIMAFSKTNNRDNPDAGMDILNHVQRKSWLHVPYDEPDDAEYSEGRAVGELEWEKERERERAKSLMHEEEEEVVDQEQEDKIAALERELLRAKLENEKLVRENEKLGRIVEKFKLKWEKLKEGARNKRPNASSGGGGSTGGGALSRVDEAE